MPITVSVGPKRGFPRPPLLPPPPATTMCTIYKVQDILARLKPHILFYSNGLATLNGLPDIRHIKLNNAHTSTVLGGAGGGGANHFLKPDIFVVKV